MAAYPHLNKQACKASVVEARQSVRDECTASVATYPRLHVSKPVVKWEWTTLATNSQQYVVVSPIDLRKFSEKNHNCLKM